MFRKIVLKPFSVVVLAIIPENGDAKANLGVIKTRKPHRYFRRGDDDFGKAGGVGLSKLKWSSDMPDVVDEVSRLLVWPEMPQFLIVNVGGPLVLLVNSAIFGAILPRF